MSIASKYKGLSKYARTNIKTYGLVIALFAILFPLQNLKGADKLSKEEMLKRAYETAKLVQIDELMDRCPSACVII